MKTRSLILFCILTCFATCSDEREWKYPDTFPIIFMPTPEQVDTSMKFTCDIEVPGKDVKVLRYGFCWYRLDVGTSQRDPTIEDFTADVTEPFSNNSFSVETQRFVFNYQHDVRAFIVTEGKIIYSNTTSFTPTR